MKKIIMTMVGCIGMMTAYAQGPMVRLSNGVEMPQFGIGTFAVPSNEVCKEAVLTALRAGYRHIDTAHAYMDERGVGDAVNEFIAEGGCKREDIWVTSKIWPSEYSTLLLSTVCFADLTSTMLTLYIRINQWETSRRHGITWSWL